LLFVQLGAAYQLYENKHSNTLLVKHIDLLNNVKDFHRLLLPGVAFFMILCSSLCCSTVQLGWDMPKKTYQ